MSIKKSLYVLTAISFIAAAPAAFAAGERVNEVDQRVTNQENRVNAGVQNGTVTAKQADRDDKRINKVETQASKDEAKDGGKLTKAQQRRLNRKLDKNSTDIKDQKAN